MLMVKSMPPLMGVGVGLTGLALMLFPGGTEPVNGASNAQVALWSVAIAGVFLTLVGILIGERWNFSVITPRTHQ